jgi:hypothetical protein
MIAAIYTHKLINIEQAAFAPHTIGERISLQA